MLLEYTGVYHHLFVIRLNRDVAVCAVDDAAGIKLPTVVCHALDRRLVLAGEGYTCQSDAIFKRTCPDVLDSIAYRHTRQAATQ